MHSQHVSSDLLSVFASDATLVTVKNGGSIIKCVHGMYISKSLVVTLACKSCCDMFGTFVSKYCCNMFGKIYFVVV